MSAKIPPKPSKDVIYIDVDDEITGIIDKVENSAHKVVALVLPKRAASLQSIVNMKLLKRSGDGASKSVVLITNEAALLPLAGAAGLHVAKNLQSAPEVPDGPAAAPAGPSEPAETDEAETESEDENGPTEDDELPDKIDYERPVGALAAKHEEDSAETIDLDNDDDEADKPAAKAPKKPKDKKNKVPNFDRFRLMLGLAILGVVALIVFIILALFVLPKATINIQTASEPVTASFNLAASSSTDSLDTKKGDIPAKLETKDLTGSQKVTATGQQNNGDKATGSVTFTNCNHDGSSASVPAGTGISSSDGLNYITQSTASMPNSAYFGTCKSGIPNTSATVEIVAIKPGSNYNSGSTSFNVSCSSCSDVSASGSASGGTDDIVTILSQNDVDGVKQKLTSGTDADNFTKDFEKGLSDGGEYVLISTLKAGAANIDATPAVGQPASTATVSIKITYSVLTVQKDDLSQAIENKVSDQVDKTKQKLNGNFLNDAIVNVQSQPNSKSANLAVNVNTTAVPIIDIATVKKQAEGKKAGDIQAAISNWAGVKNVDVKLSPFWISKAPGKDSKIKVVLTEVKQSGSNSGSGQ